MRLYLFFFLLITNALFSLADDPKELYIDLMKKILCNTIYEDQSSAVFSGHRIKKNIPYHPIRRENGLDWPAVAHTMIGMKRLNHIHECAKVILNENIPGDFIETGVWRGGAVILMRAILKAYGDTHRLVWAADSFEGLPKPNVDLYPKDRGFDLSGFNELAVSLDEVKRNFEKYELLDEQVVFLKGLFSKTLKDAPLTAIALLRLDGDLYESTMDALTHLYPKLSAGGYVIIDDYKIPPCRAAVKDYRSLCNIEEQMIAIDQDAIYWRKK